MRVTASDIVNWANTRTKESQALLPRLVRRLCFVPGSTLQLAFPAGDSTYVPGWDGVLVSSDGNAWIPRGKSLWEIGCDQDVSSKANSDYRKRTEGTPQTERATCTFVFVTPRRWIQKTAWLQEQRSKGEWADVRVYDADDLEQWLEQTPAVAVQFAEELGRSGVGVESLGRYWQTWARQCDPPITPDAFFMDRAHVRDALEERLLPEETSQSGSLVIRADSIEEGVAFVAAVIATSNALHQQALIVTEPSGWRYVAANPQLPIAIAASIEAAASAPSLDNLLVVVPQAKGDYADPSREDCTLVLDRPGIYEFEQALCSMGLDDADAKRYAAITGRSWTVFRRQRAKNPAIRHPVWLDEPQVASLSLLCLLGAWNADCEADCQVVERVAGRPYEAVEEELHFLAAVDDAPVLSIGRVWKAKSPLELLSLFGARISRDQLDRFFLAAQELLASPDPQLELPDEERWMAQVYGKVRPQSGLLFDSFCDSLVKLAVRGPDVPVLRNLDIEERVRQLVRDILDGASEERWLSLASYLPALAEAAPDAFVEAVARSLRQPDTPVCRLITETSGASFGGRCWHAGLLWALEIAAWAPRRLPRVALILAQLCRVPMEGNWVNSPGESLLNLVRAWLPQTAASLEDRLKVLDLLVQKEPDVAFELLKGILGHRSQFATPSSRPKWRDEDAGAGRGVERAERDAMVTGASERLLQLSEQDPRRIASVLDETILRKKDRLADVLALIDPYTEPGSDDEGREVLRTALRKILHWHHNYGKDDADDKAWLAQIDAYYDRLEPRDSVIRHRWLFDAQRPDAPTRQSGDCAAQGDELMRLRSTALAEVYFAQGMAGVETLVETCKEPWIVGQVLAGSEWIEQLTPDWWLNAVARVDSDTPIARCVAGFLNSHRESADLLQESVSFAQRNGWTADQLAHVLTLGSPCPVVWDLVEKAGDEVSAAYWRVVSIYHVFEENAVDIAIESLLRAKRPRTALNCCCHAYGKASSHLILRALEQFRQGEEADAPLPASWHLGKALDRLAEAPEVDRQSLIRLEFALFPALVGINETRASILFEELTSNPETFVELVNLAYPVALAEDADSTCSPAPDVMSCARQVLESCERIPGAGDDGAIDREVFDEFVSRVRQLCPEPDHVAVCDRILGRVFAHAPADEDGTWPCAPVRDILDQPTLDEMRQGFFVGIYNKRGVTIRSMDAGGQQERELATDYAEKADRIYYSHPNVAAVLEMVAKGYERQAKREDIDADLRRESF